jgi:hypothetical protein
MGLIPEFGARAYARRHLRTPHVSRLIAAAYVLDAPYFRSSKGQHRQEQKERQGREEEGKRRKLGAHARMHAAAPGLCVYC